MARASDTAAAAEHFQCSRRLRQADEFKRVFATSVRFDCAGFVVLVRASDQHPARLGLAISKRRCRLAVDRNKLKRIVRESFRVRARALPAVDIVVLCNVKAPNLSNCELFSGLDRVWKKVMDKTWLES